MNIETNGPSHIWRYEIDFTKGATIELPPSARVIHVGRDQKTGEGTVSIWVLMQRNIARSQFRPRRFLTCATGRPIDGGCRYLGTAEEDGFVAHVFEELPAGMKGSVA